MLEKDIQKYTITADAIVVDALQKIDKNAKGILFVVDESFKLVGAITDGDIRRWLLKTGDLKGEIGSFMNKNPLFITSQNYEEAHRIMLERQVTAIPVIDKSGILFDIYFSKAGNEHVVAESRDLQNVPVVIMAGGKGTRLYPYTKILPKPLIPIGDIPIMERIIRKFMQFGVKDYYATVNYRKSMIRSYFSDLEDEFVIKYVEEDKPLGTAGSLKLIEGDFGKPFIVTNCDILVNADYSDIYKFHKESGNEITIVSALKNITVPYGVINSTENGAIEKIDEKPRLSYFVNTGMYVLNDDVVDDIPKDAFFHMTHLIDKLIKEGRKVGMYPISEESFLDMGEFEEMRRMEQLLDLKSEDE